MATVELFLDHQEEAVEDVLEDLAQQLALRVAALAFRVLHVFRLQVSRPAVGAVDAEDLRQRETAERPVRDQVAQDSPMLVSEQLSGHVHV